MDTEQSLLKLDAYCRFRQMTTINESEITPRFIENIMALTSEALAGFKLASDSFEKSGLQICKNVLANILSYIRQSPLSLKFRDIYRLVEEAYEGVMALLTCGNNEAVTIAH